MRVVKIINPDKITGLATCIERDEAVHAGPLYDVAGTFMCEMHLFTFGRQIADLLAESRGVVVRGKPGTGLDSDTNDAQGWPIMLNGVRMTKGEFEAAITAATKKEPEQQPEPKPFTWG